MEFVIGTVLGVVGLILGVWAEMKRREDAKRSIERERVSDLRARNAERQLGLITGQLRLVLEAAGAAVPDNDQALITEATGERRWSMGVADVNNDGLPELLVASLAGAHSTLLQVFGQRNEWPDSFGKLTEMYSTSLAGFTVGDLDGDGLTEVATVEQRGDHPYVASITEEALCRWNGEEFVRIASSALPKPGEPGFDDPNSSMRWQDIDSVLSVR